MFIMRELRVALYNNDPVITQYCPETFSRLSSPFHTRTRPTGAQRIPKSIQPTENRKPTLISVIISYTHQFASAAALHVVSSRATCTYPPPPPFTPQHTWQRPVIRYPLARVRHSHSALEGSSRPPLHIGIYGRARVYCFCKF